MSDLQDCATELARLGFQIDDSEADALYGSHIKWRWDAGFSKVTTTVGVLRMDHVDGKALLRAYDALQKKAEQLDQSLLGMASAGLTKIRVLVLVIHAADADDSALRLTRAWGMSAFGVFSKAAIVTHDETAWRPGVRMYGFVHYPWLDFVMTRMLNPTAPAANPPFNWVAGLFWGVLFGGLFAMFACLCGLPLLG